MHGHALVSFDRISALEIVLQLAGHQKIADKKCNHDSVMTIVLGNQILFAEG